MIQCSAGRSLFRSKLCKTELTDGLCTSWRTNRCDWKEEKGDGVSEILIRLITLTQTDDSLYSHSNMLSLLSEWYFYQVCTHSSNEEVYVMSCYLLAAT